eukprot:TRINITY_DN4076_c0_g1_i2.p1 TRINITY_DN4076_c0_g1~~TRINITY_DN4076_c0_g1_i2.p1  ORF type:complete len:280 (+),score=41.24 TRINITY_DN4076_c0_g1_i2:265-1104(+)
MGTQKLAHQEGELAVTRAIQKLGTINCLSTASSYALEDVAAVSQNPGFLWFQLYFAKDRSFSFNLIKRAEAAGYSALVVTVDLPVSGNREMDLRNKLSFAGFEMVHLGNSSEYMNDKLFDASLSWSDIVWLKSMTKLPILLKGILTPEDAIKAAECGVAGIVVSNHGGRQLDTVPATIQCLPAIAKALSGTNLLIVMDGGIRRGSDVFKAIALGAHCVLVGRPVIWGLTLYGEDGVSDVLNILKNEFHDAMVFSGCKSIRDITPNLVDDTLINLSLSKL